MQLQLKKALGGFNQAGLPDLQSQNHKAMQTKQIQLILMILVLCLQGLHLASSGKTFDLAHYIDDLSNQSYTEWNSATTQYSYTLSFAICAAGLSFLIYALLLVVKLVGMNLSSKIQEILFGSVAVLQFSLGVQLAITQSRYIDPNGNNSSAPYKTDQYIAMYNTQLADTVIIWVICVPGSYLLAHFASDVTSGPAPAKAQTELGLRT